MMNRTLPITEGPARCAKCGGAPATVGVDRDDFPVSDVRDVVRVVCTGCAR